MKRSDRPIQLRWYGEIVLGEQNLVLELRGRRGRHVEAQWLGRCVLYEYTSLGQLTRGLMRALRASWRTKVLGANWAERKRVAWIARREAEARAEHKCLLGIGPAGRLMLLEFESYKARWP